MLKLKILTKINNIKIACILIYMIICVGDLFAQDYALEFDRINQKKGLSQGTIHSTFKDSRGFIWFATQDGLNRFDSHEIIVYRNEVNNDKSLSNNRVTAIAEDSDGNLWIGTDYGLNKFDWKTEEFTQYVSEDNNVNSISGNSIKCIFIDKYDNVLIGTQISGLSVLMKGKDSFLRFEKEENNPNSIGGNFIYDIIEESNEQYWISTNMGGIVLFNLRSKTFENIEYDTEFENNHFGLRPILKDQNGDIWLGGKQGVHKFLRKNNTFLNYNENNGRLNSNIVSALYEDVNGLIWVGTDGGGINILDPVNETSQFVVSNPYDEKSLSTNAIYDIYEDDEQTVWVGTYAEGVHSYNPKRKKFKSYESQPNNETSLSYNAILQIKEGRDGKIWVGTDSGGLDLFDPETESFVNYKHNPFNSRTISGNVIKSIHEDEQGVLWLGTYAAGLMSFDQRTKKVIRLYKNKKNDDTTIGNNNVWEIYEDKKGNLWIGLLTGGLDLLDRNTNTFTHYRHDESDPNSLSGNTVKSMLEDSRGNFWVGTEWDGLNLFDRETGNATRFLADKTDQNSIINDDIRTIYEDHNNVLWIGTSNGICTYNYEKKSFESHEINDQLEGLIIGGILQDEQNNFWISTNKGLSKYNPKTKRIINFNENDGLQNGAFSFGAAVKTKDKNTMYFGGLGGLSRFSPSNIKLNDYQPKVSFTQLNLFENLVKLGDTINNRVILKHSFPSLNEVELSYKENVFSIEFAALDYLIPENNLYSYQLLGFDESESIVNSDKRRVTYTNLDQGTYTLVVKATNIDGVWSSNEARLTIVVTPPWWKTTWFRISLLIFFMILFFMIYRWRTNNIKQQKLLLENEIENRTAALKQTIKILKRNNKEIVSSGDQLKLQSGVLTNDAQNQIETARSIEDNLESVALNTRKNSENAKITNQISDSTVSQLGKIETAVQVNIHENKEISHRVEVLEEIFRQTNILAINASIEAANAGVKGGGFRVIANEIRKLAEKSRNASQEIVSSVKNSAVESERVGKLINDFIPEIKKSASLIDEITHASNQQAMSIDSILNSLREFFRSSEKNAKTSSDIHQISIQLEKIAKYVDDHLKENKN